MMLSEHFSLLEFVQSDIAARHGIDNTPSPGIISNLVKVANMLERVRAIINAPIRISSGYRCEALNLLAKGSKNSAHMTGSAADFTAPLFGTAYELCKRIRDTNVAFDQLIYEYRQWAHLSIGLRRIVMTKNLNQPYRIGLLV